jgi:hypothetical protein
MALGVAALEELLGGGPRDGVDDRPQSVSVVVDRCAGVVEQVAFVLAEHVKDVIGFAACVAAEQDRCLDPRHGQRWRAAFDRDTAPRSEALLASALIASGCDVVTVHRTPGHPGATTTLNTYSHLWPTAEDRTRKAAEAMLAVATRNPKDSTWTQAGP